MSKKYEELEFTDGFLFSKIMYERKDLCKELLELILQKKIERIEYVTYERVIEMRPDSRGVRLDVYTKDEEQNSYDIEMQVRDYSNLPRRSRYYHSMIDLDLLEKSEDFSQLRDSYVIFICKRSPGKEYTLPINTFLYQIQENPKQLMNDGSCTVFVNAEGDARNLSAEMQEFLAFIRDGKTQGSKDGFAGRLADAVTTARDNQKWRADYMTYEQEMKHQFFLGKEEGRAEGLEEGIKGIVEILRSLGIKDEEIKNQLMEKYALSKEQAESYVGQ